MNTKALLGAAVLSVIESIRNNPDKFSSSIYHECDNNNTSSTIIAEHFNRQCYSSHANDQRQGHSSSNYSSKVDMNILTEEAEKLFDKLARETKEEIINHYAGK